METQKECNVQVKKGVGLRRKLADSSYLASRGLSHHRLIWRRQVSWVQCPWAVDGYPIDSTEGGMGKVQVQASVRDITEEFQPNNIQTKPYKSKSYLK